ncbi:MAG: DNA-processing protein DprA [Bacillota bacterium]
MEKQNINEFTYLNALNRISAFGPKRIKLLLDYFNSAAEAWKATRQELYSLPELQKHLDQFLKERESLDPEKEWERLIDQDILCTCPNCAEYPYLLKQLPFPPPLLYYKGNLDKLANPVVAIVGSRRSTYYGKEAAQMIAEELASAGVGVVSGMALGIDTAAHKGALGKRGYTLAVLGCGLDHCYPSENKELMGQIVSTGAVISEFPLDAPPLPKHFPQRNRIISGISLGTVVVEATAKSGSLITANYALEQNREVFAVPGNIGSPYSRGCHSLIKEGAHLVESAADILEELYLDKISEDQLSLDLASSTDLTKSEQTLLNILSYQPMHVDNIIRLSGNSAAEVITDLLSLELKKKVRQTPGKYFGRI